MFIVLSVVARLAKTSEGINQHMQPFLGSQKQIKALSGPAEEESTKDI